jgi:hypothetical protein
MYRYIHGPMRRIDGWCTRLDAEIAAAVAQYQNASHVAGSVGEIGVHHGRSFVALALAMKDTERAFAIDVFGEQQLNEDHSGCGDAAMFRRNLSRHGIDENRVAVLQSSSLQISWPDIERAVGAHARLFSIDGGHTAEIVANDLEIANAGLCDEGVVIADDYFNSGYPGVSEGTARFMLGHKDALRPFAIGDSRMFLCRPAWAERYRAVLHASPAASDHAVTARMWGGTVSVFRTRHHLIDRLRAQPVTRAALRHRWAVRLKPAVRWLLAPR